MKERDGSLIDSLAKDDFRSKESFVAIAQGFDNIFRRDTPVGTREEYARRIFGEISQKVPQGFRHIYWLARAYPVFIPIAIPFIQAHTGSSEEQGDAMGKVAKLSEIAHDRENPIEYTPQSDSVFSVSSQVERTIYNAIKYNDQGRPLLLAPLSELPGIPGDLAVSIEQDGDNWGVVLHIKSRKIDKSKAEAERRDFYRVVSEYGSNLGSVSLQDMKDRVTAKYMIDYAIGRIDFGQYPGAKPYQERCVEEALGTLRATIPTVMGEEYSTREYSKFHSIVEHEDGSRHSVAQHTFETDGNSHTVSTIDGLVVKRFGKSSMPHITEDYEQFQEDLQNELKFASGILSWLYQYSRTEIAHRINLQSPDFGLLDWMEGNNLIEKLSASPNALADLGGNNDLRLAIEEDTSQFVRSYNGKRGVLKPQNTIIYGETGIGKTALENGIAAKLIEADVPVFVLKGDLFAQTMLADPEEGVTHLKQMFYYLLMHGGAVMVRDFDALLGSRERVDVNTIVEGVLLSELQRIKEDPSTWFVADTQFIGRISEALLNAHRIGTHREVPIETEQQGIEQIITAVVRKVDKEIHKRRVALEFASVQTMYPFDIAALAVKIAEHGGLIPAQIERIVREEMQSHADEHYRLETDTLLARVDDYAIERERMGSIREKQRAEAQQAAIADALATAQAALETASSLEEGFDHKIDEINGRLEKALARVRKLDAELANLRESYSTVRRSLNQRLGILEDRFEELGPADNSDEQ